MVKLTMVSAALLLAVILAMAEASSAFRISVMIDEEEGVSIPRGMKGKCVQKMMKPRVHMLSQCQMYLREKMQERSMNPFSAKEEYLDMCCQQLRSLDEKCRCDGLKMAVMQMQREGEEKRMPEIEEKVTEETTKDQKMGREAEMMYSQCDLTPCSCHMSRTA